LIMGGQDGGIYVDANDWFQLSQSFRNRTEALARSIASKDIQIRTRALYLTPHLWSRTSSPLWQELHDKIGIGARLVSSVDLVLREQNADVLVVDPSVIFTRETLLKVLSWAKAGRCLVIPRSALYTESARAELESVLANTQRMEIGNAIPYRLHQIGDGKLFVCDYADETNLQKDTSTQPWKAFIDSVFSVAGIQPYCSVSDSRLSIIPLEKRGGGLGLFVLNGSRRKVAGDIIFQQPVSVSDLSVALSAVEGPIGGMPAETPALPRFSLEVPACGIFPLAVDGAHLNDQEERHIATEIAQAPAMEPNVIATSSGASELPGLDNSVWN
jgi:hypothetical protein